MKIDSWETAFGNVDWRMPAVLSENKQEEAVAHLTAYFATTDQGVPHYSGAHFETLGGGGDRPETRNKVTADDLWALELLNINVDRQVVLGLLTPTDQWPRPLCNTAGKDKNLTAVTMPFNPDQVSDLLSQVPTDVDLSSPEAERLLMPDPASRENSPSIADQLWWSLRRNQFARASVSKLLARKRPRLFPVIDRYLTDQLSHKHTSFYTSLRTVLRHDGHALEKHLREIREEVSEAEHLSSLRVFDVIVWRAEEQNRAKTTGN